MTNRPSPILLALLGLLVVAAGYLLLWKPRSDDLASVRAENESLTQDLTAAQAAVNNTTATTDGTVTGAFATGIPATPDLSNLLRQLQTIGTESGVAVQAVTPAPATALPTVPGAAVTVSLTGTGTKAAIDMYVSRLGALPRIFVVDKINVSASAPTGAGPDTAAAPTAGTLQLQLDGRVFTTLATGGQGSRATTATPATTAAARG